MSTATQETQPPEHSGSRPTPAADQPPTSAPALAPALAPAPANFTTAPSTAPARYSSSTDAFGDYPRRIGKGPLLTAVDEVTLAQRIEVGLFAGEKLSRGVDDPSLARELAWLAHDGRRAKNRFIESNLRLVVSIAKHYS
ncbi:sigma-70 factor domain-containing protein, partial [Cryobacterium sp. TMT2-18-2]|uniref:sigma-70 factor domain-containing protein n=2 Tax=unclassified Cryobacterium TaxID=2649013 RepID=UPI00110460B8